MTRLLWALGGGGGVREAGRAAVPVAPLFLVGSHCVVRIRRRTGVWPSVCMFRSCWLGRVCALGSAVWGRCLSDHLRCGVMGCECPGDFLEEVLCCLEVGLKVFWEPEGKGQGSVLWGLPTTPRPGDVVLVAWPVRG